MTSTYNKILIFAFGAALGSVITWRLLDSKYKQMAQDEINEVRDIYLSKEKELKYENKPTEDAKIEHNEKDSSTKKEYTTMLTDLKYKGASKDTNTEEEHDMTNEPYVISPEEFGEKDYDTVSLTYYSDGVLEDDFGNIIENIEGTIGIDSLNTFGEYEDDSVFVRNDDLETDYEILLDVRSYREMNCLGRMTNDN